MTRNEFMNQLRAKLYKRLTENEVNEALSFYEEYFNEAGLEHEEEAAAQLGEPSSIAAQIIGDRAMTAADEQPLSVKKGLSAIWWVVLGLFAAPIALPVAIGLVGAFAGILMGIFAVIVFFLLGLFAIGLMGAFLILLGLALTLKNIGTALVFLGTGLALFGLALLFVPAVLWIANVVFRALAAAANSVSNWFRRRFNKKNDSGPGGSGSVHERSQLEYKSEDPDGSQTEETPDQVALQDAITLKISAPRCPGLGRVN